MKEITTIAIPNKTRNKLLKKLHWLENKKKERCSYADVIEYLLEKDRK